jgi:hypothetical protein
MCTGPGDVIRSEKFPLFMVYGVPKGHEQLPGKENEAKKLG